MKAQRRTAKWKDPTLYFHLREAGVARAEIDIRRQHQLDANGQAVALGGDDHRFADPWAGEHAPGIAAPEWWLPTSRHHPTDVGQVQPGGEVVAVGEHHGHPRIVISIKFAIGQAEFVE